LGDSLANEIQYPRAHMKRQQIAEQAFAVVLPNRMIAFYDRNALGIFVEKAAAMAFKRQMAMRLLKCRVV
jgi:hypothetical protein